MLVEQPAAQGSDASARCSSSGPSISTVNIDCDRLRVVWIYEFSLPREQKMLKGHLPRVIYHQVY